MDFLLKAQLDSYCQAIHKTQNSKRFKCSTDRHIKKETISSLLYSSTCGWYSPGPSHIPACDANLMYLIRNYMTNLTNSYRGLDMLPTKR